MPKIVLLVCFLAALPILSNAQKENEKVSIENLTPKILSKTDSLELELQSAKDTNRVILLNKLSFQYYNRAANDKALKYAQDAFALSSKLNYKKGLAKSMINTGNVLGATSKLEESKQYYLQALELAREIKNDLIISHAVNNLGEYARRRGDFPEALGYYLEALRIDEKSGDKGEIAASLNNIGLLYQESKDNKKAIEFYNRSLKLSEAIQNRFYISVNLANMANLYLEEGNDVKALGYYKKAMSIKTEIKDVHGVNSCLIGIGNIYFNAKKIDSALSYFSEALIVARSIDDKPGEIYCLNNIGAIFSKKGQVQKAIEFHQAFLKGALDIKSKKDLKDAYHNLSEDYNDLKDYKKALEFQKLYSKTNDSLFSSEKSRQIAEIETKYESEKKLKEIELLKTERSLQKQINRNQKIIFGSILVATLMAGFVYYFRAQAVKQRNIRLSEKVDAQNRELSTIALLVSKKNQSFTNLKSKLTESLKSSTEQVNSTLKSAIKEIDQEINFDDEWDTFKYHFEKVHPGFFTKLKEAAPALSDRELRFCAYLKSNLSTKEIAKLTGSTVRSVQQNKYRINQKLPASVESNLTNYLLKL